MTNESKLELANRDYRTDYQFAVAGILTFAVLPIAMIFDLQLASGLDLKEFPGDLKKLIIISEAFSHGLGAAIILLAAWLLCDGPKQKLLRPIAGVLVAGLVANLSKLLILRHRPHYYWDTLRLESWEQIQSTAPITFGYPLPIFWSSNWDESQFQSFPSAHSAIAMSLAVGLSAAFPKGRFLFLFLAMLAGLQRIACHAHWPSDVVAGFVVGILSATVVGIRFPITTKAAST